MKTLLITGAGKGIGHATALLAAKQGHQVIALSRNIDALKGIERINPYAVDLAEPEQIENFIAQLDGTQIDVLLNNAGLLTNIPVRESNFALYERIYKVNVFGLAELTRLVLPQMTSSGHIVNISSMGGIQGTAKFPGLSAYSSSKGGLIILTELLAEEFKETGPAFNALALGAVQTEMLEEAFPGYKAPISASEMANYILDFAFNGQQLYNGKVLPIASSTP